MSTARFQIVEVLGAGRWGAVCVALDTRDRKAGPVALKVMLGAVASDRRLAARARDEARILSRLRHANLVEVRDAIEIDNRPVLVMEWVDGLNLEEILAVRPRGLPPLTALAVAHPIAVGLDAAWRAMNVLHRDLKPANVMLSADGRVKVADFGLAKADFAEREARSLQGEIVLGSRAYASPERADGLTESTSDVYSLGLVLLELLTGARKTFSFEPRRRQIELDAWLARYQQPPEVEALLRDTLQFDAEARPSIADVADRLGALLGDQGPAAVAGLAREVVVPQRAARTIVPPEDHPAWPELRAIGAPLGAKARALGRARSPEAVREHLATIDRASRAWWDLWSRQASQESVIISISALKGSGTPEAAARFRALALHADPDIAAAARAALDEEG